MVLGLTPHGRPDRRHPPVMATVDERVSLEAVVNAIADIMGDHNRFGLVDRALASRIGRAVQTAVADAIGTGRISSSTQLTGQQAFWGILVQHLASTSSAHIDQESRRSLLHYMRTQANRTSADFANFVAQFRRGGGYTDRGSDRDGGALLTSARFDAFSGADAVFMSAMRRYAMERGLHWAADRPEILRMGEEAIRILARTGFSRQSHDRLEAAGFTHRDMVRIARYAERTGQDVNTVSEETAAAIDGLAGGNAEAREGWVGRFRRFFENPDDEEARREMDRALNEVEASPSSTDGQREGARRTRELLRLERQAKAELQGESDTARAEREAREAKERALAEQRAREEAERVAREAEVARIEAQRREHAALLAGDDPPGDAPPGLGPQQGPAAGASHQRAEATPSRLTSVAPT